MAYAALSVRVDEELKKQAEELFDEIGLSMSAAITIFLKQSVREQRIPFELNAKNQNNTKEE